MGNLRLFLLTSLAFFTAFGLAQAAGFDVRDAAEFNKIIAPDAKLTKLAGDMKFTEGPVWLAQDGGYLVFSDIPANELKQWTTKGRPHDFSPAQSERQRQHAGSRTDGW